MTRLIAVGRSAGAGWSGKAVVYDELGNTVTVRFGRRRW